MAQKTTDLFRAKRGVAVLAACIVETLSESDPTFQARFLEKVSQAYRKLKDGEAETEDWGDDVVQEMELLAWTRSLLTGFDLIKGQQKPFLK